MFRLKYAARAALLLAVAACASDVTAPAEPGDAGPAQTLADAAHSGAVPGFYFLPPMVPAPPYAGTFDAGLQPRVEICELAVGACGPTVATFPFGSGSSSVRVDAGAQQYITNWHSPKSLDANRFYRIQVFVGATRLGFADVDVVRNGKEKQAVDATQFVALMAGQTLPIKFRIETGIAAQVIVSPDSASIPVGGTQAFTATVLDLHGDPLAVPVTWSSSDPTVATVDSSGVATGVVIGQATITATAQAASDGALLTVFNPNTPPVALADTFEAIGNVTVPVAAPGVLANDTDGESNPLSVVAGTFPTASGGTVTLHADGGFSYLSAAGFTGQDSFTYTVTDGLDSVTANVSLSSAYRVWYVDNAGGAPGDGRDASAFTTLKAAEAASAAGETIFLRAGNGTSAGYDEGIVLKTGQALTGQGIAASVTATLNGQTVVLLPAGSAPTVTSASGTTVQLSTNNVLQGFDVASTAGAGIGGAGFGTLTVAAVSVGANGGPALDLSSGDVLGAFGSLSSSTSAGAGIRLLGVGGSFSAAGGTLDVAAGATGGVDVTGGAGTFSYGGDVVATGPLAVSVSNRTGGALTFTGTIASTGSGIVVENNGGGTIAFNGASKTLSTGANVGVRLANNGGTAISFGGGGLAVATAGATAFEATGGGTVTVTGAGNTLVSTGAAALRVENATIGGAGLSFRSVSASGGANGIVLVNTGALNGVQVTGTGAAGSGGTITGMVGADGSTGGIGVYLSDARSVSLSHMALSGFDNFAIRGFDVSGFEMDGTVVSGASGTSAVLDEAAVAFDGLTGAASVSNSGVSGGVEDNFRVVNAAGILNRLTIRGSTFGANSVADGGNGVYVEGNGSAVVNVTVQSSRFTAARTSLLRVNLQGSAQSDVVLTGNTFANAHPAIVPGAGGVVLETTAGGTGLTYQVAGNSFRDALGSALAVQEGQGIGTVTGTITGNTIGVAGVSNSGSAQGSGISLTSVGGGSHTVGVMGNQVRQYNNQGILLQIGDNSQGGNGTLNATVTGNVVSQPGTAPTIKNGIHLNAGLITNDNPQVCVDIGGVGGDANTLTGSGSGGAAGSDVRLRQRFLTSVRLPGYAGANNDNAAVAAFVQARNGGTPTVLAQNTVATGGGGFLGGAGCPQP